MARVRDQNRRRKAPRAPVTPKVKRDAQDSAAGHQSWVPPATGTTAGIELSVLDRMIANVVVAAVDAVQSQGIPAEEALRGAMEALTAAQKPALELVVATAKAQAEIVQQALLESDQAKARALGTELGELLAEAIERGPEVAGSVAGGIADLLNSATNLALAVAPTILGGAAPQPARTAAKATPEAGSSEPPQPRREGDVPVDTSAGPQPADVPHPQESAPEAPPAREAELLDAILDTIAKGYLAGLAGGETAAGIRSHYPAAVPQIQQYLGMEDFLVLMWMQQQPATAQIAREENFAHFFAEFKAGMLS